MSGLEAVLKKKDVEIKQLKDMIKQLKEKEIEITKVGILHYWQTDTPYKRILLQMQQYKKYVVRLKLFVFQPSMAYIV